MASHAAQRFLESEAEKSFRALESATEAACLSDLYCCKIRPSKMRLSLNSRFPELLFHHS